MFLDNNEKLESFVGDDQMIVILTDFSPKSAGMSLTNCKKIIFLGR